ncbi:hypothetical protein EG68_02976 [Paragonimus skrjabini miyazakii]|uniref:Uncharacterized protein n=1 Tax=Paragonimus skrjabini miyazakii TaxID=59628 RepID=A0A8S9Z2F9_9TREM|nr:hypothetical protein EG68_02976 [Paragonimus skrjabini miyazakii]
MSSAKPSETYGEAMAYVFEAITKNDGVANFAKVSVAYRPKRSIMLPMDQEQPRRLTESTMELSAADNATSSYTLPEGNNEALAEYHIIDVNLPPNPQLIHTSSPVVFPRLIQPMGLRPHSVLIEQRSFSPINFPSYSFLQPIP